MARIILITGGNRGIGRELGVQLAAAGDTVILGGRNRAAAETAVAAIPSNVRAVGLDVTDPASVTAAAAEIDREYGHLDVLANNAGILYDHWQSAASADLDTAVQAYATNVLGAWRVTQVMLPLLRRGQQARIVNVSSEAASLERMGAGVPAYRTSKAALNALTRIFAAELEGEGITVHAVSPGWPATDLGGEGGRPIPEGAASIRQVIDLLANSGTGGFWQDGQPLPW